MAKETTRAKTSNYPYLIGLLIGLVLLVIIAIQNSEEVTVKLLIWEMQNSLSLFLTLLFTLGFIIGVLTSLINIYRKDRLIYRQTKQIEELEEEAENLRKKIEEDPNI